MKRLVLLSLALGALALPAAASAHPLGNFTVNRFSRIEVAGPRVYVRYVLDLAEIPTFQAGKIDAQLYARRIARGAHLTVNGRRWCSAVPRSLAAAKSVTATRTTPTASAGRRCSSVRGQARATSYARIRRTSSRVR